MHSHWLLHLSLNIRYIIHIHIYVCMCVYIHYILFYIVHICLYIPLYVKDMDTYGHRFHDSFWLNWVFSSTMIKISARKIQLCCQGISKEREMCHCFITSIILGGQPFNTGVGGYQSQRISQLLSFNQLSLTC